MNINSVILIYGTLNSIIYILFNIFLSITLSTHCCY